MFDTTALVLNLKTKYEGYLNETAMCDTPDAEVINDISALPIPSVAIPELVEIVLAKRNRIRRHEAAEVALAEFLPVVVAQWESLAPENFNLDTPGVRHSLSVAIVLAARTARLTKGEARGILQYFGRNYWGEEPLTQLRDNHPFQEAVKAAALKR